MPANSNSTKRLLYIVPGAEFGGIERVVHEIANWLALSHSPIFDVHVVFFGRHKNLEDEGIFYGVHYLENVRLRGAYYPLKSLFRSLRPDLICVAQCEMSTVAYLAMRTAGIRSFFVSYLHGNPKIERKSSFLSRIAFQVFDRVVAARVDAIFAVSRSLAAYVLKTYGPRVPVVYIANPVQARFSLVNAQALNFTRTNFVCVARLCRQKGQDILLHAFAMLIGKIPSAKLTLVGDGPEGESLRQLACELEISDSVEFVGFKADPTPYLLDASCFVLPSRWEGFGVVVVEALEVGLPVITTDCDFGPQDVITDRQLGIVVESENAGSLAAAMFEIGSVDPDTQASWVARRQEHAALYRLPVTGKQHFDALQKLVSVGGPRPEEHPRV